VLSFTAAESWESLYGLAPDAPLAKSIFFVEFSPTRPERRDAALEAKWETLMTVRSEITKALEGARREKVIGLSLDAEVLLQVAESDGSGGTMGEFIRREWQTIQEICIISQLTFCDDFAARGLVPHISKEVAGLMMTVRQARAEKCERCWTRSTTVGQNHDHPQLCQRCATVVADIEAGLIL
jgi:isoleucyl-tRNA synthetase